MYLSKVFLRPGKLNNTYEWHRALWSLFPNVERGSAAPFLYYMESLNLMKGARVLMQSSIMPITHSDYADVLAAKPFPAHFYMGQRLRYLIHANPTKCITDTQNKPRKRNRGKCRVPLIKEVEQHNWLKRKLNNAAIIHETSVRNNAPIYFRKGNRAGKIVTATFTGIIKVCDPDQIKIIWENGIGPAKAFGCGLLLIKRI